MLDRNPLSTDKQTLLLQRLRGALGKHASGEISRRATDGPIPLTFAQLQMWVIDQLTPGNPAYNLPVGYRIKGNLNVRALEKSFNAIIQRHETLRTTFAAENGVPVQVIHKECRITIETVALDDTASDAREARVQELASEESLNSFDLSRLPLIRVSLFKLDETDHVLIVNLHHIVSDGISMGLILDELDTFYEAFETGRVPRPPELGVQYADFALSERQNLSNDVAYARQVEFWRSQLGGKLPVLELASDRQRPAIQSFKGSNVFFDISPALAGTLKVLSAREGCTFFMTMLAAFQVLLQRYSGSGDIVIGVPLAARTLKATEPLIGNFLNMIALRFDLCGDPAFNQLLGMTRTKTLAAFSNSELPFEAMVNQLKIERDPSRNSIFQVMLQMLSAKPPEIGGLEVSDFHFDRKTAQFDLSLHLYEEGEGYLGRFEYCTELFHRQTVERLSSNFIQLLEAIAKDPRLPLSKIPILSLPERNQILYEWNDTQGEFPARAGVHDLFEAQAERTPERIAVVAGDTSLTFAELETRANRIAQTIRARGVGRGQRVGLCVQRGTDMLTAMLGILKSGAAYVPLDPSFPQERLRFMADDAKLSLLVSTTGLADAFGLHRERQLLLDADATGIDASSGDRLPDNANAAQAGDAAYVIYTSGSTGKPKGVIVPHRAVVSFLTSMARKPGLTSADVLVAITTLSFDIAVLELLLPLSVGATVVIAARDETVDGTALQLLLERRRATVMQGTPATWRLLLDAGWKIGTPYAPFKALVGGETMPKDLADQLLSRGVELWNMYGPTETTVWSTCAHITGTSNGISIGAPIANTTIRILDAHNNLCPIGVPGELCIGGDGVALGYWNRPELTADRFIRDPFSAVPETRLYRTGDCARWRGDGELEHLGRLDFQVKIRGFRIEAGEIEAGIASHPAVREVVVVAREDIAGDKQLVAYLVLENAPADIIAQLRGLIRASMPEYMVPSHFVTLDALPRTHNGKIDRKALPAPATGQGEPRGLVVLPRSRTEEMVTEAFASALGRSDFGVTDSFFDLGGNSLTGAQLMLRLRAASGLHLPLRSLFDRPTAAGLAAVLDGLSWMAEAEMFPDAAGDRVEIEL